MSSIHLLPQRQASSARVKWVTFSIAGYRLGMSIDAVLRVVNYPQELKAQSNEIELVEIGQHTLTIVNLKPVLRRAASHPAQSEFLIVTKPDAVGSLQNHRELCALRVDTPPDLIELDPASIRQLPTAYRQHHPLSVASRVAVLPQGKATLAIFLIEMNRALKHLHE